MQVKIKKWGLKKGLSPRSHSDPLKFFGPFMKNITATGSKITPANFLKNGENINEKSSRWFPFENQIQF